MRKHTILLHLSSRIIQHSITDHSIVGWKDFHSNAITDDCVTTSRENVLKTKKSLQEVYQG